MMVSISSSRSSIDYYESRGEKFSSFDELFDCLLTVRLIIFVGIDNSFIRMISKVFLSIETHGKELAYLVANVMSKGAIGFTLYLVSVGEGTSTLS